jgi:two pore calcium channel protein
MPPKYGAAEDDPPESQDERPPSPPGLPGASASRVASDPVTSSERPPSPPGLPGASTASPSRVTFDPTTSSASPSAAEQEARDRLAPRLGASYGATSSKDAPPKARMMMSAARERWQRAWRKVKMGNRMRKIIIEGDVTPHAAAAFMVHEAWGWQRGGVEMDGRLLSSTRSARKLYRLFHNYTWARRIPIAFLLILPLLELPAWCMNTMCELGEGAPSGWYVFLEPNTFHAVELVCALCVLAETYMMLKMQGGALSVAGIRRMDPVFHAKFFASGALILDCIVSWSFRHWFRLGGYLRIAIFVLTVPQVRKSVYNVVAIVPKFVSVAVLFVSYVVFGGWLSLAALSGTDESETYSDLWTSICLMMVLLTTANNPDAWLGAYAQHRAWGIFFLAYVCFGNFYLMSLLLATIYGVYKEQAGNTANGCERERAACLREAFKLLDTQKSGFVHGADAKLFVEALNNHTDIPSVSPAHLPALMEIFTPEDGDEEVQLAPAEFEVLVDQLQLKFGDIPNPALQRSGWGPVFGPLLFGRIRGLAFVRTKAFGKFITAMLCFNALVVLVEWNKGVFGFDETNDSGLYGIEGAFGMLYLVEMLAKWGGHSFVKYWRDPLNAYDGIITILSTGVEIALVVPNGFDQGVWLKWLIVMRVLRLTRLLIKVRLYKVIISTFFELLPSLFPLLCAFGCIVSVFATYGVQQFGGLSYRGNPRLEGTSYAEAEYYDLNLNDFPSALVMLVCQCIVNNWFVVMDGYAAMTGSEFTRLYFILFYFVATVFVLNLVIVVILDAAMAIIEADIPIIPDVQNLGDIDDDDEARFLMRDEEAEKEKRAEEEIAAGADAGGGAEQEKGLRRMMSLTSGDAEVFVAPPETNKGKSQRAILDFRSKLAAFTKGDSDSSDEEDLSLAEQIGAASPMATESRADDDAIFDPDRQRLTGGATRAGLRVIAQQQASVRGIGGLSRSNLLRERSGSGNGRRPRGRMSLLRDEGDEG